MKIVVFGMNYFCYTTSLVNALISLGHDVTFVEVPAFQSEKLNISEYIKYKFNSRAYKENFINEYVENMKETVVNVKPEIFISVGANNHIEHLTYEYLKELKERNIKLISWNFDSVQRFQGVQQHYDLFDEVYSLEENDAAFMKSYSTRYYFIPIGVAEEIYCRGSENQEKKYDVCFVGGRTENRLRILNKVACYCEENNKKLFVCGPYWNKNHWWKNMIGFFKFKRKYPYLARYVVNGEMTPEELSDLYSHSKICLNIHVPVHKNTNPRTFEILGNGNFELCDYREDAHIHGLINEENIVYYTDDEDAVKKIDYFLKNDKLLEKIALNGKLLVRQNCTMKRVIERFVPHVFSK